MKPAHRNLILALIVFSAWLFFYDKASEPGALQMAHVSDPEKDRPIKCADCHVPWQGVSDHKCLDCHHFKDVQVLKPQIRFHEARQRCLDCHTEHQGRQGEITRMDHQVLNPALSCTACHVDPHGSLFGADCRACHAIKTWNITGFQHPDPEGRNCSRCHPIPKSHRNPSFWESIQEGHYPVLRVPGPAKPKECWRCHITHRWDHLRMPHD